VTARTGVITRTGGRLFEQRDFYAPYILGTHPAEELPALQLGSAGPAIMALFIRWSLPVWANEPEQGTPAESVWIPPRHEYASDPDERQYKNVQNRVAARVPAREAGLSAPERPPEPSARAVISIISKSSSIVSSSRVAAVPADGLPQHQSFELPEAVSRTRHTHARVKACIIMIALRASGLETKSTPHGASSSRRGSYWYRPAAAASAITAQESHGDTLFSPSPLSQSDGDFELPL
jgi:hypothetical protein